METNEVAKEVVAALAALAQESRLSVYRLLVEQGPEGLPAGRIGEELGLAPATLSFHLAHLSRAKLVRARQEGRFIFYSADFDNMNALVGFLTENCCARSSCAPCAPVKSGPARNKPAVRRAAKAR